MLRRMSRKMRKDRESNEYVRQHVKWTRRKKKNRDWTVRRRIKWIHHIDRVNEDRIKWEEI